MVLRQKAVAQHRLHPHQWKEVLRDGGDHCSRRFGTARDRLHARSKFRQPLQRDTLRTDILKVGVGKIHSVAAVVYFPKLNDLVRLVVG